jgi:hypothetical protein
MCGPQEILTSGEPVSKFFRTAFGKRLRAYCIVTLLPGFLFAALATLEGNPAMGAWAFVLTTSIAVVVSTVGALPVLLTLHVLKLTAAWAYLAGGLVLGIAAYAALMGPTIVAQNTPAGWPSYLMQMVLVVVLAMMSALAYWGLTRPDRPDTA